MQGLLFDMIAAAEEQGLMISDVQDGGGKVQILKSQIATSNKAVTHEILFIHLSIKKRQMELTVIIQSKIYEIRGQQVMFDFDWRHFIK